MSDDSARNTYQEIPVGALAPWPGLNPRRRSDAEALAELTLSVKEKGVLEPLLVAPANGQKTAKGVTHLVVAGERRLKAAQAAKLETAPCIVCDLTEADALEIAITENVQRADLSPVEEARSFQHWLELHPDQTQGELGQRIGRSQAHISNRIRLLQAPEHVLELVEDGLLDVSWVRDYLLPFNSLREDLREKFHAAFVKELRGYIKGLGTQKQEMDEDRFSDVVSTVVQKQARDLDGYDHKSNRVYDYRKAHKKCTCGAPKVRFGRWGDLEPACFDRDWFNGENGRAAQREKERLEREQDKLQEKAATLSAGEVLDAKKLDRRTYRELTSMGRPELSEFRLGDTRNLFFDPALLPPESLALVKPEFRGRNSKPELACVDMAAFRKARTAAKKERNALLAEKRAEIVKADLWLVRRRRLCAREIRILLGKRPMNDSVARIAKEIGLPIKKQRIEESDLAALKNEEVEVLAKVIALRVERGESLWDDPTAKAVDKQLKAKYARRLSGLIPDELKAAWKEDQEELARERREANLRDEEDLDDLEEDEDLDELEEEDEPAEEPADEDGSSGAGEPAGRFTVRKKGNIYQIVDTETDEVRGTRQRERDALYRAAQLEAAEAEAVPA